MTKQATDGFPHIAANDVSMLGNSISTTALTTAGNSRMNCFVRLVAASRARTAGLFMPESFDFFQHHHRLVALRA